MELTSKCLIIFLAMIFSTALIRAAELPAYEAMHCLFHSASDDPDSCLLGGKETACKAFKCLQTVGKPCSNGHEVRLTGNECAKSLACGCDRKCNGCMIVNGIEKCHWAACMPLRKRNPMKVFPINQREQSIDRSIEYPAEDVSI